MVAPAPDSDVYLLAQMWRWYPVLKFKRGKTYRPLGVREDGFTMEMETWDLTPGSHEVHITFEDEGAQVKSLSFSNTLKWRKIAPTQFLLKVHKGSNFLGRGRNEYFNSR